MEKEGRGMRLGFLIYQFGALGVFLTIGIFWNEPMVNGLKQGQSNWPTVLILFGFAIAAGLIMLFVRKSWIDQNNRILMYVTHGLALLSIFWLLLWCFVWLAIISARGESAEMFIKHMADLHLFGVGFSMAGYVSGWLATRLGERSVRFLMTVGWGVSYTAWLNLYLQPGLIWLWAPAVGGLLVLGGLYLMTRPVKPKVETPA
jgi:hypothetical protein